MEEMEVEYPEAFECLGRMELVRSEKNALVLLGLAAKNAAGGGGGGNRMPEKERRSSGIEWIYTTNHGAVVEMVAA